VVGALRRVLAQQRWHRGAEVVDVARQHEPRTQAAGHGETLPEQRQGFGVPARVQRVDGIDDDFGTGRGLQQRRGVGHRQRQCLRAGRQGRCRCAPNLGQDPPAGLSEGQGGGLAEAAVGAEDEDGVHGGFPCVEVCSLGKVEAFHN
jgi:hypothetical protein